MIYFSRFNTNLGTLFLASKDNKIIKISFENKERDFFEHLKQLKEQVVESYIENETFINEINDYLDGKIKKFTCEIVITGTNFQQKVYNQLLKIEYGKVCTYKDIAIKIGNEKACRAVGLANNKNHLPIIIPCHRVIGASKKLVGYAGGLDIKQKLLDIENENLESVERG